MTYSCDLTLPGVNPAAVLVVAWKSWLTQFDRTGVPPKSLPKPKIAWNLSRLTEAWVVTSTRHPDLTRSHWHEVLKDSGFMGEALRQSGVWPPAIVLKSPNGHSLEWLAGWLDTLEAKDAVCMGLQWPGRSGINEAAQWGFTLLSGWWDAVRGQESVAPAQSWMSACDALADVLSRLNLTHTPPWGTAWFAEYQQNKLIAALVAGVPCPSLPEDSPAARRFDSGKTVLWSGTVESLIALAPVFVSLWHHSQDYDRMNAWRDTMVRANNERSPDFLTFAANQDIYWARWARLVRTSAKTQWKTDAEKSIQDKTASYLDVTRDAWKISLDLAPVSIPNRPRLRL